uniref:Argininosuccinate lyase n=1 Tax=candidate division WOR-3 bacterium TaxID=2052148 RepID=A0A7V3RHT8_UNCW3
MKAPVWHKRLKKRINPEVLKFTESTGEDKYLVYYDIISSLAHIGMLKKQRLISTKDYRKIKKGLNRILTAHKKGRLRLSPLYEDVHMNIEQELRKNIGDVADKLHTARSRNDLIATELRLYCRDWIKNIIKKLTCLQMVILSKAEKYKNVIIPGYTHLQRAQPMLVPFYLISFILKFQRDIDQLLSELNWVSVSPLGSCAFTGTGLNIDRKYTAQKLGFKYVSLNALDAVSDRDFMIDFLYYLTRIMVHISTLAEDLIIFSTNEFRLVELDDSITTGSSIMPHKRNPDVCELLRAKCGKGIGNLVSAITILKGLPSSYNRDLQEMKSILLKQVEEVEMCLKITEILLNGCTFKTPDNWVNEPDFTGTVDLIDFFVNRGYPFRKIYEIIGECVRDSNGDMEGFIKMVNKKTRVNVETIRKILIPASAIENKRSDGSTGREAVEKALEKLKKTVKNNLVKLNKTNS